MRRRGEVSKCVLSAALLCGCVLTTLSSDVLSSNQTDHLSRFVASLMECKGIPGLQLAIVDDQHALRVTKRGYGMADIAGQRPVTSATSFCVASLTKAFTSLLLGKLLKRSRFNWDTPVNDILSDPVLFPDPERTRTISVRDLLLHRTGIPRYDMLWYSGVFQRDEILRLVSRDSQRSCHQSEFRRQIQFMKESKRIRESAIYNNIMYALAGKVAEQLGGKSWEELITEEILEPLEMNATTFYHHRSNSDKDLYAKQYLHAEYSTKELDYSIYLSSESIAPAIALCSNSEDLSKWMTALLRGFHNSDPSLRDTIPSDVLHDIFHPQIQVTDPAMMTPEFVYPDAPISLVYDQYGLGWFVGRYNGSWPSALEDFLTDSLADLPLVSHYGSFPGFYSMLTMSLDKKFAIFSSINGGEQPTPYNIHSLLHTYIVDMLMDRAPWLDTHMGWACTGSVDRAAYEMESVDRNVTSWRSDDSYEGVYTNRAMGTVTVDATTRSGVLLVQYGLMSFLTYPWHRWGSQKDIFLAEVVTREWLISHFNITFTFPESSSKCFSINEKKCDEQYELCKNKWRSYHPNGLDEAVKLHHTCKNKLLLQQENKPTFNIAN
ncbi:hypothetical protein CAPTEDRAFT_218319 [Capitella teleta]|uniref:Beta-lactamase-related domain-containing protein n=1 Tax=Capitella teleta TaxID=283909 RepID=R7UU08_CAPTE|nr:hypothetical protein CAPTEDRAFT_218319 [Capitella teleta]|eukprot:ELU06886.1 hypothetical protein CAPTEDRAFT_218319 [Capitella teleta]